MALEAHDEYKVGCWVTPHINITFVSNFCSGGIRDRVIVKKQSSSAKNILDVGCAIGVDTIPKMSYVSRKKDLQTKRYYTLMA